MTELLAVHRLVEPSSEWRLHRQWFDESVMDEPLEEDTAVACKDRVYRCSDRQALLNQPWPTVKESVEVKLLT